MGKNFVQFRCHHCNHCCTDVVCLPTPWDVKRIIKMTGADPDEFLEFITPDDITGVSKNDPTWLTVNGRKYIMALRRDNNRCFFLDKQTRLCNIYEARPILCRLFPFKLQETRDGAFRGFTLHTDVGCPRHRDGEVPTKPLYDLYIQDDINQDDYRELVRIFNEKEYKGKKPSDFVQMFMHGLNEFDQMVRTA